MEIKAVVVPTQTPAESLPDGYNWFDFQDGSGILATPDNEVKCFYDLGTGIWVNNPAGIDKNGDIEFWKMPTVDGKPSLEVFKREFEEMVMMDILAYTE